MSTNKNKKLFESRLVKDALKRAFVKLSPVSMFHNPVMFTVWIGTLIMGGVCIWVGLGAEGQGSLIYNLIITFVLFLTLLFANFAEAIAEARG